MNAPNLKLYTPKEIDMKKFLILTSLIISVNILAQSSSPYSRYGIGDLKYSFSPRYQALGQLGVSIQDKYHISTINPATWTNFDRTKIEFAMGYNGVLIQAKNKKSFSAETEVEGLSFGFPISEDLGIGFAAGIIPISRISYLTKQNISNPDSLISNYDLTFEGKGGLSKIFLGTSVKVPFDWSLGASFDYYFGNLRYISSIIFNNNSNFSSVYELIYRPTGFGLTFGILSADLKNTINLKSLSNLRLGASINYFSTLNTDSVIISKSSVLIDTVAFYNADMKLPARFNIGLSFTVFNRYLFTFDYSSQAFSNYKIFLKKNDNLQNSYKISTGFELQPDNDIVSKFWERVFYRFGLSYEKTPYKVFDIGIEQYSISGGITLPINPDNLVDIALQYSVRGTNDKNLLKENFFILNLSIIFNELWFLRIEK